MVDITHWMAKSLSQNPVAPSLEGATGQMSGGRERRGNGFPLLPLPDFPVVWIIGVQMARVGTFDDPVTMRSP